MMVVRLSRGPVTSALVIEAHQSDLEELANRLLDLADSGIGHPAAGPVGDLAVKMFAALVGRAPERHR